MLSDRTEKSIDYAVIDDKLGDEISARIEVSVSPTNTAEARAILNLLNKNKNSEITNRLFIGLAGDRAGGAGKEIAHKLNKMIEVLEARVKNSPLDIQKAKIVMGGEGMSDKTFNALYHGLANKRDAEEFREAYNTMVAAIQGTSEALEV